MSVPTSSRERFRIASEWCRRKLPEENNRHAASTCLSLRLSNGTWPTPAEVRTKLRQGKR